MQRNSAPAQSKRNAVSTPATRQSTRQNVTPTPPPPSAESDDESPPKTATADDDIQAVLLQNRPLADTN
ncbi:hypothetical protein GQ600_19604 [Phytophthora cactorum]|nr:hypothetical protein GQ600_19604 [Phytophthora cactorum]